MPYRRRYYKRSSNRDKYSVEQTNITTPNITNWTQVPPATDFETTSYQFSIGVIPPIQSEGMRKVKHITASFSNSADTLLYYALVFVPQGYEPQTIHIPSSGNAVNNYSANQFVMSSGVLDFSGGPCRIRSPLSRNLNSGDSIWLILGSVLASPTPVNAQISYAMTLQ